METVPDARVEGLINISTIDVFDSPQESPFYPSSMLPNPNLEHCSCLLRALDLRQRVCEGRLDSSIEEGGQSRRLRSHKDASTAVSS